MQYRRLRHSGLHFQRTIIIISIYFLATLSYNVPAGERPNDLVILYPLAWYRIKLATSLRYNTYVPTLERF
jgi:hypothetical protein